MIRWVYLQTKRPMPPNPAGFVIMDAFLNFLDKFLGQGTEYWAWVYREGKAVAHGTEKGMEKCIEAAHRKMVIGPSVAEKIKRLFRKKAQRFLLLCGRISRLDLAWLSNKELWQWYEKYFLGYKYTYPWGEPLAWLLKDSFVGELAKILEKKTGADKTNEILQILITPPELSFASREERDLMELAFKLQKVWHKTKIRKIPKPFLTKLQLHTKEYAWVPYDYGVVAWELKDFQKRLLEMAKDRRLVTKLKKYRDYSRTIKKQHQKLYRKLKIAPKEQKLFKALQILAHLNDLKKEVFSRSHLIIRPLQEEMARRIGINWDWFSMTLIEETKDFMLGRQKVDKKLLKERFRESVLVGRKHKALKILAGAGAKKLIKEIEKSAALSKVARRSVKEIRGQVASKGIAVGRVKILLSPAQNNKIKKGDILLAVMTSPDYVVAMKKAAAIVTDEGGLTSHAAIVSRELKKPCIIGTKVATKVLKDGDLVEVDANKGVVRILKKRR